MKLTDELKGELKSFMDSYWGTYLKGDLEKWASFLPDDYQNIGTTQEEIWHSKKDILDYTMAIKEQMVGMAEMRNKQYEFIPYDPYIMVHELGEIHIKTTGGWAFYSVMRLSSLLQLKNGTWQVLHQHGSYPDMKAQEGEAFGFNALQAENRKLQEAVEARTKELQEKNRELEIETALEKVRAVAMSMTKADDLKEVCKVLYEQLGALGFSNTRNAMINIYDDERSSFLNYDYSARAGKTVTSIPYDFHPLVERQVIATKNNPDAFYEFAFSDDELKEFRTLRKKNGELDDQMLDEADSLHYYFYSIGNGSIGISTYNAIDAEVLATLKRFRNVFNLAYKRYTEIFLAEAQAREAQIEAALERVRARTMAMQHSGEIADIVGKIFSELRQLDLVLNRVLIWTFNAEEQYISWWSANPEVYTDADSYRVDYNDHPVFLHYLEAWQQRMPLYQYVLSGDHKKSWEDHLFTHTELSKLPQPVKQGMRGEGTIFTTSTTGDYGLMMVGSYEPLLETNANIIRRFGRVFQQSYTRYLDVQKAEAQAREADIELALERVRARTMAMQKSNELKHVIQVVYDQFTNLKINVEHTGFIIDYKQREDMHIWLADRHEVPVEITIPYFDCAHWNSFIDARKTGKHFFENQLDFEEKNRFYKDLFALIPGVPEETKAYYFNADGLAISTALLDTVGLYIENFDGTPYTGDENAIVMRFGKVFQQTYTRFLDLQKAEAQAREAQVEAALERVRSRTMAMHKSEELKNVVATIVEKVSELDIEMNGGVSLATLVDNSDDLLHWYVNPDHLDEPTTMYLPYFPCKVFDDFKQAREQGLEILPVVYSKEEKNTYFQKAFEVSEFSIINDELKQWILDQPYFGYTVALQPHSAIFFNDYTGKDFTGKENEILVRFSKVFEQTYTRFLDLQKAEAQAREAQVETALEKVRSKTLAMQHSSELADTSAVLFQQLIGLGILPNRLYICIIKDDQGESEFWITDEDGTKVSMAYEDNLNNNPSFKQMFDGWRQQSLLPQGRSLIIDMKGDELQNYFNYLNSINVPFKGGLQQKRRLQYLAYFSKGFIGMASPDEQPAETLQLLERFAYVFNLTFTRFNDLKVAEAHALQAEQDLAEIKAARQKAETALTELQATQNQLIHSEKMASLGELTAGIAHEIQNPLNFVNNFSEVSRELLDEIKEELDNGNLDEAKAIMNDVIQNLEKINHHGKRADGIVKGMLQHSRSSSGQKELADINVLCDEYLRLAYHGFRAKDKSFNAAMKTDLDTALEKVHVIPQDIGRVILNLITNAFYAVSEKWKAGAQHYEPLVKVSTRRVGNKVEIEVADNGNGIPATVKEKIFQPFFTTKPTGQGTGLGLSLSYDIVKAHSGKMKVESRDGEGSIFIIELPSS